MEGMERAVDARDREGDSVQPRRLNRSRRYLIVPAERAADLPWCFVTPSPHDSSLIICPSKNRLPYCEQKLPSILVAEYLVCRLYNQCLYIVAECFKLEYLVGK